MSGRGLLLLLGLLAIGVAVVVFVDRPTPEEEKKSETLASQIPVTLDGVGALERERGGDHLRLERGSEGGWRVAQPFEAEADPRQVKFLFEAAVAARIRRVVEEKASDMKPYGLDPPEMRLSMLPASDSTAPVEIALGRSSPVGSGRYVGTAGGKVLLVEGLASGTLEQGADSFVEKRLLPVEAGDIRKISLGRTAGRLTLEREGSDWRLVEPVADVADPSSVDTLARSLVDLSFSRLVEGPDLSKARASVAEPAVEVQVQTSSTDRSLGAELARTGPGEERYACRENGGPCGVVAASALLDLERPSDDYRDRRLLMAAAEEIREVTVKHAGGDVRLFRTGAGKGAAKWSVQEGAGPVLGADSGRVDGFLDRLRWLRASTFEGSVATLSLDDSIVLTGEKGELGRLEVSGEPHEAPGEAGAPPQKRLYARSSWRPGVLFTVPTDGLGTLPRSAADLAPEPPGVGSSQRTP